MSNSNPFMTKWYLFKRDGFQLITKVIECRDTLENIHNATGIKNPLDFVTRVIGGHRYTFMVDDEYWLEHDKSTADLPTALTDGEGLYGPLLIAGDVDQDGEMLPLTDEDIEIIENSIMRQGIMWRFDFLYYDY